MKNSEKTTLSSLPSLPPGWVWATPQDLCSVDAYSLGIGPFGSNLKVSDYRDIGVPLVFVRNIRSQIFDGESERFVSIDKAEELKSHWVSPGDLLITKMGDPPGDVCLYPTRRPLAVITADCIKFRLSPTLSSPNYFVYALRSDEVRSQVIELTSGVAQQKISLEKFKGILIPVAPLAEQTRIVAEIEKQLTELDAGVAALKRVQTNLKRYRASVLKAACEGRLVPTEAELARAEGRDYEPADKLLERILQERRAKWEADQIAKMKATGKTPKDEKWKSKYSEPMPPAIGLKPLLPEGWVWASLDQISWSSGYGTSSKCDYAGKGIPVLRIPNISGGRLEMSDIKYASQDLVVASSEAVDQGDLLIVRTNGSKDLIGRGAVITSRLKQDYFFASYLIRYRLVPEPSFLRYMALIWHSPCVRQWVERTAATSAGQYNISMGSLGTLAVPIPPLAEQSRLIAEAERRVSMIESLVAAVNANLIRADSLRQSILKRAFEGTLVPQDPNDEPASVLLERIRQERVAPTGRLTSGQMSLNLEKPKKPRTPRRSSASA